MPIDPEVLARLPMSKKQKEKLLKSEKPEEKRGDNARRVQKQRAKWRADSKKKYWKAKAAEEEDVKKAAQWEEARQNIGRRPTPGKEKPTRPRRSKKMTIFRRLDDQVKAWTEQLQINEATLYRACILAAAASPPAGPASPAPTRGPDGKGRAYQLNDAANVIDIHDAIVGRYFYGRSDWIFEWALVERADLVSRVLRLLPGELARTASALYADVVEVSPCVPPPARVLPGARKK